MGNLDFTSEFCDRCFPRTLKPILMVITASALLGMLSIDSTYINLDAQTTQQKCIPDMGTNISKSNCFSNAASAPVYNMTSTENARPPPPAPPK